MDEALIPHSDLTQKAEGVPSENADLFIVTLPEPLPIVIVVIDGRDK